jgi:hypothetical protein
MDRHLTALPALLATVALPGCAVYADGEPYPASVSAGYYVQSYPTTVAVPYRYGGYVPYAYSERRYRPQTVIVTPPPRVIVHDSHSDRHDGHGDRDHGAHRDRDQNTGSGFDRGRGGDGRLHGRAGNDAGEQGRNSRGDTTRGRSPPPQAAERGQAAQPDVTPRARVQVPARAVLDSRREARASGDEDQPRPSRQHRSGARRTYTP